MASFRRACQGHNRSCLRGCFEAWLPQSLLSQEASGLATTPLHSAALSRSLLTFILCEPIFNGCVRPQDEATSKPTKKYYFRLQQYARLCRNYTRANFWSSHWSCSNHLGLQADDGYLYPLERAFFYIHKPPTLIIFDEIDSVEFLRQGGGLVAASVKTFDLNVRQKNDQVDCLFPHLA